jgi:hypothetical protein
MMVVQFVLQDLLMYLLYILGITAIVLLIPVLLKAGKVVGMARAMLLKNQESIQRSIRSLPVILENAGRVSQNSKEITNQLRFSIPVIAKEVEEAARVAKDDLETAGNVLERMGSSINETVASYKDTPGNAPEPTGFMAYVPLIKEVLQLIEHTFSER